jgi:hypothetical protein
MKRDVGLGDGFEGVRALDPAVPGPAGCLHGLTLAQRAGPAGAHEPVLGRLDLDLAQRHGGDRAQPHLPAPPIDRADII